MLARRDRPPAIGIIGGVGPWVDPLLLKKLLQVQAERGLLDDQHTLPVLLAQFGCLIGDRTAYLDSLQSPDPLDNPAIGAASIARGLVASGARVLGVPCNTFHAEPIFSEFKKLLGDLQEVSIVHMIEATVDDLVSRHAAVRRIGILSTNGTYAAGVFPAAIHNKGLDAIVCPPARQAEVHDAIYNREWGIKSGREASAGYPTARAVLDEAVSELNRMGADIVILGCTEIPLALDRAVIPLHDPLDSLARELVGRYVAATAEKSTQPHSL